MRKGSENVVGPMPPFGEIIKTDAEIWKIIAWIRSVNCERRPDGMLRCTHASSPCVVIPIHTAPYVKVRYWHKADFGPRLRYVG